MTVAELIELLKTYPQYIPVTGYNGAEQTDFITKHGVRLRDADRADYLHVDGKLFVGQHVDIMGL